MRSNLFCCSQEEMSSRLYSSCWQDANDVDRYTCIHARAGGSAGIGKATALEFDANGATVAVLGRRLERLEAVVKEMKHGHAIVGDLTNSDDMKRAMAEAVEKMGGLDILINNGGVRDCCPLRMVVSAAYGAGCTHAGSHCAGA